MRKMKVNSSRMPIYRDAGFELYDAATTSEAFRKETLNEREPELYIYSRYRNPTVVAAEDEIMKLEGSEWALLTQSGMSAIDTAVSCFHKGRDTKTWLFFTEIYGGTISFIEAILKKRRGIQVETFAPVNDRYDLKHFERLVASLRPAFVYIEAISNPMLIVPDVQKVIAIAKKYRAKTIVDNTFATPALWKPLETGADLVIHSCTKYFSGHGNISAGVVCGNDRQLMKSALEYRKFTGHMLSPDDAYRLHTQIQTFSLRFAQQCKNAAAIAELLGSSEKIEKIWYPGNKNHPTFGEAVKLFGRKGFGGMVTFEFCGRNPGERRKHRDRFIRNVSGSIKLIPTLGDPATILMPVESVWGEKYPRPGMIRMSAGFEDTGALLELLNKALSKV